MGLKKIPKLINLLEDVKTFDDCGESSQVVLNGLCNMLGCGIGRVDRVCAECPLFDLENLDDTIHELTEAVRNAK